MSTHFEPGFSLDPQRDGTFAGLLAIDIAADHDASLLVRNFAVINFGKALLVDVTDGLFEEVAKENITVRINEH